MKNLTSALIGLSLLSSIPVCALAATPTNQELFEMYKAAIEKIAILEAKVAENAKSSASNQKTPSLDLVGSNGAYNFKVLDHSRDTNTKQLVQLQALRDGQLE